MNVASAESVPTDSTAQPADFADGSRAAAFFFIAALLWLGLTSLGSWFYYREGFFNWSFLSLFGIWLICLADIGVTGKFFSAVFRIMTADSKPQQEKSILSLIQAFSWGTIKLAFVGFLIIVIYQGRRIPSSSLVLGIGTLFVVPVAGGLMWHCFGNTSFSSKASGGGK